MKKLLNKKENYFYIVIILTLIVVEPSINSWLNFWLQRIFDTATLGIDRIIIVRMITLGFAVWIVKRVIVFSLSIFKSRFVCNLKQDLKDNIFFRIMNMDTASLSQIASSGEYISVFTNDITIIEQRFFTNIIGLISNVISLVILSVSFFALDRVLATLVITFGISIVLVPICSVRLLNRISLSYSNKLAQFTEKLKEYMTAYPTIKNYSIEKQIFQRFSKINKESEDAKFEFDFGLALSDNLGAMLSWFMQLIAIGAGLILMIQGEILVGAVISAKAFASDIALPLQNIVENVNSISSVNAIIKKIKMLSKEPEKSDISQHPTSSSDQKKSAGLLFEDVSIIQNRNIIVSRFSFLFECGKKYLIIGKNGAGKSSLFKALKKQLLYDGKIYIDGSELSCYTSDDLSKKVSYLGENISLFSETVKNNILLFRDSTDQNLKRTISQAGVCISGDRVISDNGYNVSSGERRRIEIARALLEPVDCLVFDEVISTLDIETAFELERFALDLDNTVIFVSHNFSGKLLDRYDEILVINEGQLLAHGSYPELIETCEYFRHICEIKFGFAL